MHRRREGGETLTPTTNFESPVDECVRSRARRRVKVVEETGRRREGRRRRAGKDKTSWRRFLSRPRNRLFAVRGADGLYGSTAESFRCFKKPASATDKMITYASAPLLVFVTSPPPSSPPGGELPCAAFKVPSEIGERRERKSVCFCFFCFF